LCACGATSSSAGANNIASPTPTKQQSFSCPAGQEDVMQYFVMNKQDRDSQFMNGTPNPIYTEVFPNQDFAPSGYWFWLKGATAHGFDVKAFDQNYVYIRSTELTWTDNSTFKRFVHDLPIAARCVPTNAAGPQIQVPDTTFQYFASCSSYKSSKIGTSKNDIDAPSLMDAGGNLGQVMTRVLHYRYNCDISYQSCGDDGAVLSCEGLRALAVGTLPIWGGCEHELDDRPYVRHRNRNSALHEQLPVEIDQQLPGGLGINEETTKPT
jgi:hypothetical protein